MATKSNEEILQERTSKAAAKATEDNAPAELFPNPGIELPSELVQVMNAGGGADIALPDDGHDYSRDLDQSDVRIPRVTLTQGLSKAAQLDENPVPLGNWSYSQGYVDLGRKIEIVIIDMFKTRAMFVKGAGLMCRSVDFRQGIGQPGIVCAKCTLKDWKNPPGEKSTPPLCSVNYNYLALIKPEKDMTEVDPDLQAFPALMLFSRSGVTVAKEFNSKKMQQKTKPWQYWTYTLARKSNTNTFGTFFVPTLEDCKKTSPEDISWVDTYLGEHSEADIRASVNRTLDSDDGDEEDDD